MTGSLATTAAVWAIPPPIWPAPITAIFLMPFIARRSNFAKGYSIILLNPTALRPLPCTHQKGCYRPWTGIRAPRSNTPTLTRSLTCPWRPRRAPSPLLSSPPHTHTRNGSNSKRSRSSMRQPAEVLGSDWNGPRGNAGRGPLLSPMRRIAPWPIDRFAIGSQLLIWWRRVLTRPLSRARYRCCMLRT